MEYNLEKEEFDISFKVFKDDFKLLFVHLYQIILKFDDEGNYKEYNTKINGYFMSHFKIENNGDILKLTRNGIKMDDESIWFYYKIKANDKLEKIRIENTVLMDLYFDQKNLMIFKYAGSEKGYKFDINNRDYTISFDDF